MPAARSRNMRLPVAVAAVVCLVAIAWWLWPRDASDGPAGVAGGESRRDRAVGAAGAGSSSGAGPGHEERPAELVPERVAPLRLGSARVTEDGTAVNGAVRGVVLSVATEQPVAGATLTFTHGGATRDVTSGDDGTWELVPPEPGRYELSFASAPGFLHYAPEWGHSPIAFSARAGRRIDDVRVWLVPAVEYTGYVVDAEGEPVAGADVRLLGSDTGEQRLAPLADRFRSAEDGTFTFHAPDDAVLESRHPERGTGRARVGFEAQVSKRLTIRLDPDVTERADGTIAGRVVDGDGEPLADAIVRALYEPGNRGAVGARLHAPAQTATEPDGRFVLRGLDRGRYTLIASAPDHATAHEAHIEVGRTDVRLVLAPEGTLRGLVVDEGGAAVPAFAVVVQEPIGALERRTAAVQSAFDPDGRFEVGGLRPGSYLVRVVSRGHASSDEQTVSVPTEAELRFTLSRGGRVEGTVTTAGARGAPIEGARVTLEGGVGEGASAVPITASTVTDARGRYTLEGVGRTVQSIFVSAEAHHARIVSGLRVEPGDTVRVDVDLTPTEEGDTPRVELAGIGAVLSTEDDALVVGRVIEGGGAAEAGIAPGDAILAIDGIPVTDLGFQGSIERIRGPEGTTVLLQLRRADGTITLVPTPRRRIRA